MALTTDEFLLSLGQPGRYQMISCLFLLSNIYPISMNNIVMLFYGIIPNHQCKLSAEPANGTISVFYSNKLQSCSVLADPLNETGGTIACVSGWDYDPSYNQRSIVSEWDLVCDNKWQLNFGISIYFLGVMVGGLFGGYLADKFGRRPVVLIGMYVQAILGLSILLVTNYPAFVLIRFFHAIALQSCQASSQTLFMEMLQAKMRDKAAAFSSFAWVSGMAVTALIAWILDDWRHVQLAITLPSIISFFYFWFIPESMHWLITHQKIDKAEALAIKIAKFNKIELKPDFRVQIQRLCLNVIRNEESTSKKYNLIDVVRTEEIRKYTLIMAFAWFTASLVTYGVAFGLSSIASNIYLSIMMNNGLELPLGVITFLLLRRIGRRLPVAITMGLSGSFCISVPVILYSFGDTAASKTASTVVAVIGKSFMTFTWAILGVYVLELYPTVIRGFGYGNVILFTRLGGIVAPQIALLGIVLWKPAPFLICGVFGIVAALLILLLPDTRCKPMPSTINDVENIIQALSREDMAETNQIKLIDAINYQRKVSLIV